MTVIERLYIYAFLLIKKGYICVSFCGSALAYLREILFRTIYFDIICVCLEDVV